MVGKLMNLIPVNCFIFLFAFLNIANASSGNDLLKKQAAIDQKKIEAYIAEKELTTQVTALGLHYYIYEEGLGESPSPYAVATVHYKGSFLNGCEFYNSYKKGKSEKFQLNKVIKGWMQGIPLLKKGTKALLILPSNLAYGIAGNVNYEILPHSVLVFDIHLIDFYDVQLSKDVAAIEAYINENNLEMEQTQSGVFYKIEELGDGWGAASYNTVSIDYNGTFLDGTTFWSTYESGKPLKIKLSKSLKAFYEILPMLREGGKVKIITPPDMAYGTDGSPPYIPPNAILVYDLELTDVE